MSASCFLCKKTMTYTGIPKHLFSSAHMSEWKALIKKYRKNFLEWIAEYEAGRKTIDNPLPSFPLTKDGKDRYRICFGCNKVESRKTHRCLSADNLKECVDMYKKILSEEEDTVLQETISNEEVVVLNKEMEKKDKRLAQLEEMREVDEERLEKAEQYRDALKGILDQLSHFKEAHESVMSFLEEDYSELKGDIW